MARDVAGPLPSAVRTTAVFDEGALGARLALTRSGLQRYRARK
jgi:hypothetical protein